MSRYPIHVLSQFVTERSPLALWHCGDSDRNGGFWTWFCNVRRSQFKWKN
ncbi:MAG: hypothetical protein ACK47L_04265 [Pseudanabaena sp.]